MLRKPLALSIATLVVIGGGLAAWGYASGMNPSDRYKLQTLEAGPLTQNVSANGTLNPVILVNVGTQVSGTVKQLHVDFNDKVAKGQALAELDNTVLAAQARQSTANLQSALASQELALANEARMSALFAKEYVSKQEHDQAMQARKAAAAAVDLAQAQADKDRANLSYTVIRSPVSGVVVARSVDIGQTVAASFQTPTLFQIAQDLAKMQIDTSFPEADIGNIKVGMDARFTVDAFPGRSFTGKVRQIRYNPTTQQNVVTYNVVVAVDNPD
jgi:HlyD family secretion protein